MDAIKPHSTGRGAIDADLSNDYRNVDLKLKGEEAGYGQDDDVNNLSEYDRNQVALAEAEKISADSLSRSTEIKWMTSLYILFFMAGWNDATTGPLLLRIQAHYRVSYPVVSLIFICGFIGFFTAAIVNVWVTDKFGYGKVLVIAASLQVAAYAIESAAPPFPLFLISYIPNGLGMGLQDAQGNTFITRLPNMAWKMSLAHAVYGFGALVAPLVATQFAKERMPHWNFHYLCSLGLAVIDVIALAVVFKLRREEKVFSAVGYIPPASDPIECLEPVGGAGEKAEGVDGQDVDSGVKQKVDRQTGSKYKRILKDPFVHLTAIFTWIYVGLEVTIGGWAVTFIVEERGGNDNSGYVSSGFFGGLMLGRILQIWVSKVISDQNVVFIYLAIALGLEVVIWQVDSIMGNAIAYAFVGVCLGPIYPLMMNALAATLDPALAGGAIGYIAALGQCGSAIFPWVTGAMAGGPGVWTLQPLIIAMIIVNAILWAVVVYMSRHKWKSPHRF